MTERLAPRGTRSIPVRIGVIGCGAIASEHHLPALRLMRGVSVVAIAEPDPARRAAAARRAGTSAYDDPRALLDRTDVQAVVISAPPDVHAELAIAAARTGKHVFLEKPLATNALDAQRVLDEVKRNDLAAVIGFNRRLHPLYEQAQALLAREAVGSIRRIVTVFSEPAEPTEMPAWKRRRSTGGGALLDLASHHFDLLKWFLGEELEVTAAGVTSEASEHDGAWARVSTESRIEAHSVFSLRGAHADFLEFVGDRGTIRVDRHRATLEWRARRRSGYGVRPRWARPGVDVVVWRTRRLLPGVVSEPSYGRLLRAFVKRVSGVPLELPSFADGFSSLRVVLDAERLAGVAYADPPRH